MGTVALLLFAAVAIPSTARGGRTPEWLRTYMAEYSAGKLAKAHAMIPAWGRRYSKNCDACHYPAPPRLNAEGQRFKWAGYRYPDAIGEKVEVERIQNYVSLRGRMRYNYAKTQDQPASTSEFAFNDATFFYAGPFEKNYGGFFELEREPSGEVELVANVVTAWGKENSYGGFRIGQMHWLQRVGLAGFDRPTGVRTPNPVGGRLTSAVPFSFSPDQLGVEAYYVVGGKNRISVQVLNGINTAGGGVGGDADKKKDFVVVEQYLIDEAGSGITAVGYYGSLKALRPAVDSTLTSHFWRLGVSANKIVSNFEILGSFLYGKDFDLPTGVGAFSASDQKGLGYWFYGGYLFPKPSLTVFGRYERVDPNTDLDNDATGRWVLGGVLPVGLPQYLRLALEGAVDVPQLS
ncbi:MAG TPA: hypothetical protein VFU41_00610, partial [Gemmatimonadales bacterium]|nr:hypothetical protein [Gemmatimonadales bacterium]